MVKDQEENQNQDGKISLHKDLKLAGLHPDQTFDRDK